MREGTLCPYLAHGRVRGQRATDARPTRTCFTHGHSLGCAAQPSPARARVIHRTHSLPVGWEKERALACTYAPGDSLHSSVASIKQQSIFSIPLTRKS